MKQIIPRMNFIQQNLSAVKNKISQAVKRSGRDPQKVNLVAVSKQIAVQNIAEAYHAGQTIFGENKIQEAHQKIKDCHDFKIGWHFIGHLQKNKAKWIPGFFELVHSVDDFELAKRIHQFSLNQSLVTKILIQVNIAEESSKSGVSSINLEKLLKDISFLEGISVKGLMCIPPYNSNPEKSRKYFVQLRELRDKMVEENISNIGLDELSMGMSNDFEIAIEEGATLVRVGTSIFGPRK